jgi:hypothetical protein
LHPTPAVAQRDRDRALGGLLADDVAIELLHDHARGHGSGGVFEFLHGIFACSS